MKRVISTRKQRIGFLRRAKDLLIARELRDRASELNDARGMPIAAFGNDWIGIMINIDGVYERQYLDDLRCLIKQNSVETKNSIALDVGANIGNHSVVLAGIFGNVIAFEPNPRVFEILKINTKNLENVDIKNYGCGDRRKSLDLFEDPSNIGASSAVYSGKNSAKVQIEVRPLDELIDELSHISLIKIDVEGMEVECLKGAQEIISKYKPLIVLEQLEQEFGPEYTETAALDWLRERGYKIFALMNDPEISVVRRISNLIKVLLFPEEMRKIVEYEVLPPAKYNAIYAIHPEVLSSS